MNVRFVEDGKHVHSTELPEAPQPGQWLLVHDRVYKIITVIWAVTRSFAYQPPGLQVEVVERLGNDRPISTRGKDD